MGLVGGTTPATLAGTLVVTNAEILAGVVLTQLVNPGNPVMYGSSTTIMDMQYASSPVGAPEHGMFGVAVVEITESIFEDNYDDINNIIQKLRDAGIHIAIDDFGTGYSSLAREEELKVDCLKIDKYFVDKLLDTDLNKAITSDIISMAHKLGHCAIAEGVEHESQLQYLKEHDCDRIQGYLFSKPLDEEDAFKFLISKKKYDCHSDDSQD